MRTNPILQLTEDGDVLTLIDAKMAHDARVPFIHTDCPQCGYAPLHHRTMPKDDGTVVFFYHCALCHNKFSETHEVRP